MLLRFDFVDASFPGEDILLVVDCQGVRPSITRADIVVSVCMSRVDEKCRRDDDEASHVTTIPEACSAISSKLSQTHALCLLCEGFRMPAP